jgi:hypothetical protein
MYYRVPLLDALPHNSMRTFLYWKFAHYEIDKPK